MTQLHIPFRFPGQAPDDEAPAIKTIHTTLGVLDRSQKEPGFYYTEGAFRCNARLDEKTAEVLGREVLGLKHQGDETLILANRLRLHEQ